MRVRWKSKKAKTENDVTITVPIKFYYTTYYTREKLFDKYVFEYSIRSTAKVLLKIFILNMYLKNVDTCF